MLKSWPQRQWAARIYHSFKPLNQADPVLYEDIDSIGLAAKQSTMSATGLCRN